MKRISFLEFEPADLSALFEASVRKVVQEELKSFCFANGKQDKEYLTREEVCSK